MLMTADELNIYYMGGKVKLKFEDGHTIEDFVDDCVLDNGCVWRYTLTLRNNKPVTIGANTIFEWSAE